MASADGPSTPAADRRATAGEEIALAGAIVAGLAAGLVLPLTGEAREWALYLLLGASTPIVVLGLARGRVPSVVGAALGWIGAAAVVAYVVTTARWSAAALALAQAVITAAVLRRRPRAIEIGIGVVAWAAVVTLGRNADDTTDSLQRHLASGQGKALLVTAGAFLAVVASFARRGRGVVTSYATASLAAGAVLVLESFRVDYLFDDISVHHWGVFTAPAEAVRQGGWLLWDTPATYGPGSTLAIALMPTASVWDGFYLLNALACAASTWLLFSMLRERAHVVVALLLAACAVLWLPGAHSEELGGGVLATPNGGPFRFLWCQLLLVLAARGPTRPAALVGGCLVWLVGCLWSSESAVYSSAAWLPAYALLVWDRGARTRGRWLALPPALAVSALAIVYGYYVLRLGHGPDWYGFVEASVGIGGGVEALPIEPWGPVAVLVVLWWASAAGTLRAVATVSRLADAAPAVAALSLLWAVSSYFVGRSHALIVTDLLPTLVLVGLVALRAAPDSVAIRPVVVALCTAVLLLALHDRSGWLPRRPLAERWALRVERLRPTLIPALAAWLRETGVKPGEAIAYCDLNVMAPWPRESPPVPDDVIWLPIQPMTELAPVSAARRALYVRRFVARTHASGWVVENEEVGTYPTIGDTGWLAATLAETHRPIRSVERGGFRVTYYEFAGP